MVADDDATTVRVRAIGSRPDERGSRWRKAHRRREREDRQHREARSSQRGVHRATVLAAGGDGGGAYSGEPGGASGGSRFSGCSRGSWEPWWWMFVAWQPREIDRVCQPPFAPSRRATVALAREPLSLSLSLSLSLYLSSSFRVAVFPFSQLLLLSLFHPRATTLARSFPQMETIYHLPRETIRFSPVIYQRLRSQGPIPSRRQPVQPPAISPDALLV